MQSKINNCIIVGRDNEDGTPKCETLIKIDEDGSTVMNFDGYVIIPKERYGMDIDGLRDEWIELLEEI